MGFPPHLQTTLRNLAAGGRAVIFVRHAERGPITDAATHEQVLLTAAGHEAARAAGRWLSGLARSVRIHHSPVERCGETARGIAEGLREGGQPVVFVREAPLLGVHYVRDRGRWDHQVGVLGDRFLRTWLDGNVSDEIVQPKAAAARAQLRAIIDLATGSSEGLEVMVTHDFNIALLREAFLRVVHEVRGWPGFLDGMLFVLEEHQVHAHLEEQRAVIDVVALRGD